MHNASEPLRRDDRGRALVCSTEDCAFAEFDIASDSTSCPRCGGELNLNEGVLIPSDPMAVWRRVRVIVAGRGPAGPHFFAARVTCSDTQYENGDHYDAAERAAEDNHPFDESRMISFDEHDGPDWLFAHTMGGRWHEVSIAPGIDRTDSAQAHAFLAAKVHEWLEDGPGEVVRALTVWADRDESTDAHLPRLVLPREATFAAAEASDDTVTYPDAPGTTPPEPAKPL